MPPEDPPGRTIHWLEQQQKATDTFSRGMEQVWASSFEFWSARHVEPPGVVKRGLSDVRRALGSTPHP
jgi:hypothetical protein